MIHDIDLVYNMYIIIIYIYIYTYIYIYIYIYINMYMYCIAICTTIAEPIVAFAATAANRPIGETPRRFPNYFLKCYPYNKCYRACIFQTFCTLCGFHEEK